MQSSSRSKTYLLHGFRWPRQLIRIHIILQNLDDAAAEWLCSPSTTSALISNFNEVFPDAMMHLPKLRFIEQYDPDDLSVASLSQPYAYVADIVEEVKLGVDIDDVRGRGVNNEQWASLMDIRDRLAPDEKVGWFVVVCGDEERWAPPTNDLVRGGYSIATNGARQHAETNGRNGAKGKAKADSYQVNQTPVLSMRSERDDAALRELREQMGYRMSSDDSDPSSGAPTTRNTSATTPTLGTGDKTPEPSKAVCDSPPTSPKQQARGVKGWLARRKR